MGSSFFKKQRTVHQILGGGFDVMLWRRRDLTWGILIVTLAAWMMFEISGYTLLSFTSNVFLLLFTILFLWAKSAAILNRAPPPLPHLHLSQESVNEASTLIHNVINTSLSISEDIALGRDSKAFVRLVLVLVTISVIGSLASFLILTYISLVLVLTVPPVYERYELQIDDYAGMAYTKMQHLYTRIHQLHISSIIHKRKIN
ncbi:reticulon-like protein B12 isoform X2 [Salvia hispanica]|uniref:reticulon-like protein B12 isoform X2 n=1 Tax=Salvia hispanica TaxID=49212 RepID=UPI0020092695|nr:reticulon-like protein B12 isoform X2 [Salvia hispanica]